MFFDPLYFIFALPALVLAFWAQWRVQSNFKKYSQFQVKTQLTGEQVARRILQANGLTYVSVEPVEGFLSDHYDPAHQVLRLSPDVYYGKSLAAAGVAAHEVGHALQDNHGYLPLKLRSAMVPSVLVGSWVGPLIFMAGLFAAPMIGTSLAWLGIALFAGTALFALITLPVELDASRRAKGLLTTLGIVQTAEMQVVNHVLDAAALTYVAAAGQAVATLLYYVFLLTGLRSQEE
jgi:hypothetical protein